MTPDAVSRAYLLAGLSLGNRVEGLVDSYHGPDDLPAMAESVSPEEAIADLALAIAGLEPSARRSYLESQQQALEMVRRVSSGEQVPYTEQVSQCFDIQPEWTDEAVFESAHYALDQLLPGSGDIAERRRSYRESFHIPADTVLDHAGPMLDDLRRRTREMVDLPEDEQVEVRLVTDQPWSGYNWYLGNLRSRIELNTDLPVRINDLAELLAHEAYPGHHTEHSMREFHQLRGEGLGEFAIALLISPQAVISEGIATNAFEVVVPPEEQVEWYTRHVYDPAGMQVDVENDLAIGRAARALAAVSGNAALMLHERGAPEDEVVEYVVRYSLRTEREARQSLGFLTHPLYRTYIYTYTSGYDLVSAFLQRRADATLGFRELLTGQWTPSRLRGSDRSRSSDDERLPV